MKMLAKIFNFEFKTLMNSNETLYQFGIKGIVNNAQSTPNTYRWSFIGKINNKYKLKLQNTLLKNKYINFYINKLTTVKLDLVK